MNSARMMMLLIFLGLPMVSLGAQVSELQLGTRVRLRAPATVAGRLTAVVLARSRDSITVSRPEATPIAIPIAALTSLEISRGKSRLRGAGKGALWGGGVMLALGAIPFADLPCKEGQSGPDCEQVSAAENAVFAGLGGVIVGAIVGAAVGSERWERARLPASVGLAPAPFGRGLRVGLRVTPPARR